MWTGLALFALNILFDRMGGVEVMQVLQTFYFAVSILQNSTPTSISAIGSLRFVNGYNGFFTDQLNSIQFIEG